MYKIIILGSTGNLGQQMLEVLENYPETKIIALTGHSKSALLQQQGEKYQCQTATKPDVDLGEADIVINLLAGTIGIEPTKRALTKGKKLLLANKEAIVAAGPQIMALAQPGQLIPIDSEHNAIYEILQAHPNETIDHITLPCSGGPFLGRKDLSHITLEEALAHPRWNMGPKVTLESAFLINKGLEIIEAHYLFNLPLEKIKVKIHPECQIHGMVTFRSKTSIAYISPPDMREPLENALLRAIGQTPKSRLQIFNPNTYTLTDPDHKTFPGIKAVLSAFQKGKMAEFLREEEAMIAEIIDSQTPLISMLDLLHDNTSGASRRSAY